MTTRRRLLLALAVPALAALGVVGAALLAGCANGGSDAAPSVTTAATPDDAGGPQRCASLADDAARSSYAEELEAVVDEAADPAAALEEIAVAALGGEAPDCAHGASTTTGSLSQAPTTRSARRRSSRIRASSAARTRPSSCGPALETFS